MKFETSADNWLVTKEGFQAVSEGYMCCPGTSSLAERSVQNLTDASRMATLGELAAGVAHNFGNVLMGVSVTLELLQMRAAKEPGLSDMVETISGAQAEVDRGAEIIQRLLSMSRGNPITVTAVNPWLAADNAIALCSTHTNAKKVRLVNLIHNDSPLVKADPALLEEIMVNLLLNALQATDEGEVKIELCERGDRIEIGISDTGCGIAPDDMDKLFDPSFSRRKGEPGTGLGLPCSQNQIRKMGGDIVVESQLGIGSTFTIILPKWVEP
jgi:two-component system NtrC family sensor kinase